MEDKKIGKLRSIIRNIIKEEITKLDGKTQESSDKELEKYYDSITPKMGSKEWYAAVARKSAEEKERLADFRKQQGKAGGVGSLSEFGGLGDDKKVSDAIARFPKTFGLRAFPGKTFQISPQSSFVGDGGNVQLYTQVLKDGKWLDFARGTEDELRKEVIKLGEVY